MLILHPVFFSFALSHVSAHPVLLFTFLHFLFLLISVSFFNALLLYLFFSLCIILKKTFNVCLRLLYCTFYTYTLHSFFVCASYILLHLFSILFVFCASFLCLFLIAFSLIYRFSFFHFLCIFKSSFLNSLYIFIVFLGLFFLHYLSSITSLSPVLYSFSVSQGILQ